MSEQTTPGETIQKKLTEAIAGHAGWLIGAGALMIVLGILSIGAPLASGIAINLLVGGMLFLSGLVEVMSGFRLRKGTQGRGWLIFVGLISSVTGIYMLVRPLASLLALTWVLAVLLMMQGVTRALAAFELKPAKGWGWMLFGALASLLLGGMLLAQWPLSGTWALGTLFGVNLLFGGTTLLQLGLAARAAARPA